MSTPPRMIDAFRFGKRKPKRRPFVTQDGTAIARDEAMPASCIGDSLPIGGEPIALNALPKPSRQPITFDGRLPSPDK